MASAIAHALIGASIGLCARGVSSTANTPAARAATWLPALCALCAVAPDADVVLHHWVPYSHAWGHRGALHGMGSYLVAAALAVAVAPAAVRLRVGLAVFCAFTSHSLLDMLTNGGLGVALFWPLSEQRLFFDWRPIPVSPLSVTRFVSTRGLYILAHELPFALPPFLLLWAYRRLQARTAISPPTGLAASPLAASPLEGRERERDSQNTPLPGADEPEVLEIEDAIDLHAFAPRDILSVVDAYLEAAQQRGFEQVRLIHGRGKGVQRARVQKLLSTHPLVLRYADAPAYAGGWGATLVWLQGAAGTTQRTPKKPQR